MSIKTVLFDADGVIQRRPEGWKDSLGDLLGFCGDPGEFLSEVRTVEGPTIDGSSDFSQVLLPVMSRWNCRASLDDALRVWTMIVVVPEITSIITALRRNGIWCHLATNQEQHRARYMSESLGYAGLFDKEFYSCHLGMMKPSKGYFRAILDDIGVPAEQVLFIDDLQANVDSAREVGLHAATFSTETGQEGLRRILAEHDLPIAEQQR